MYWELAYALVKLLSEEAGASGAIRALHLASPLDPEARSDYLAQAHLLEFTNRLRDAETPYARDIALRVVADSYEFLSQRRWERLRQARYTFNAALALVLVGTGVLVAGVVLLYFGRTTAGVITTAMGAVSNFASAIVFKLNKDANDRLDKIQVKLAKLETLRVAVERVEHIEDPVGRESAIGALADDVSRLTTG